MTDVAIYVGVAIGGLLVLALAALGLFGVIVQFQFWWSKRRYQRKGRS